MPGGISKRRMQYFALGCCNNLLWCVYLYLIGIIETCFKFHFCFTPFHLDAYRQARLTVLIPPTFRDVLHVVISGLFIAESIKS